MRATDRLISPLRRTLAALTAMLGLSAALFAQAPPAKILVDDVIPQGNRYIPPQKIISLIKTRPGVEYSDDKSTLYDRGNCANKADGSWIVMGPDGYKAFEVDCRTIASTAVRRKYVARPVYVLQMHCTGLDKENWQQRLSIFLGKGDMLVVEGRR